MTFKTFEAWKIEKHDREVAEQQAKSDRQKALLDIGRGIAQYYARESSVGCQPLNEGFSLTSEDGRRLNIESADGTNFTMTWLPTLTPNGPSDKRKNLSLDQVYDNIETFIEN